MTPFFRIMSFWGLGGMLGLSGCASPVISNFAYDKIIAVDPDGSPVIYAHEDENGNEISEDELNYHGQIQEFKKRFAESGRRHLLIYVFGGMNSVDDTVGRSEELIRAIWETSEDYPLMINWESSLVESYADHLFFIRNGVRSYWLGPPLAPFYLLNDMLRGLVKLPEKTVIQTANIFNTDYSVPNLDPRTMEAIRQSPMRWYVGADYSRTSDAQGKRILYALGLPVRVLTTPVIEAFGKSGWDVMIRRARASFEFYTYDPFTDDEKEYFTAAFSPNQGALTALMNEVRTLQQQDSSLEITLIGHSMGPFILNEMISRYGDINFKNIVYMSAACTVRDGVTVLRPYLVRHPETTFYNLCVHPRAEDEEMLSYAVLPQGSVLEWIDLYFSNQLTLDDYTMGRWWIGMVRFPHQFGSTQKQVVLKAFGIRDPACNTMFLNMPQEHTDFSDENLRFWMPDFWKIPVSDSVHISEPIHPKSSSPIDPLRKLLQPLRWGW